MKIQNRNGGVLEKDSDFKLLCIPRFKTHLSLFFSPTTDTQTEALLA